MAADLQFEIQFFECILRRDPNEPSVVRALAHLYTKTGRIDEGLKMDRKMVRLQPDNPIAHYNLACSLALKNRKSEAVRALQQAMEKNYRDWDWMSRDPDLESLRDYPRFKKLLRDHGLRG